MEEAKKDNKGLVLWTNVSKPNQGQIATAVYQKTNQPLSKRKEAYFWGKIKRFLMRNYERF